MEWIQDNWDVIWLAFTTMVTLASVLAKLTPSSKDDAFISKIINFLALNKKK